MHANCCACSCIKLCSIISYMQLFYNTLAIKNVFLKTVASEDFNSWDKINVHGLELIISYTKDWDEFLVYIVVDDKS